MFKLQLFVMVPRLVQTVVHVLDQTIVLVDQVLLVQGVQVCILSPEQARKVSGHIYDVS